MKKWIISFASVVILLILVIPFIIPEEEKAEINTQTISVSDEQGHIIEGQNLSGDSKKMSTNSRLVYESAAIEPPESHYNAASLEWAQSEGDGEVELEFRTNNGESWSKWVKSNDPAEERPDHVDISHKALILADKIEKIQYRFTLEGNNSNLSPEVDISNAQIELIDSTKGPSPSKQNPVKDFLSSIGILSKTQAKPDGPRIYSRAEWGCPESDSSSWTPEYRDINRIVIHHTATTVTTDAATMVRAIWQFHTYTNGWGDIGYNYLVDTDGNIYQGRYYDHNYALNNRKDVVGGHVYGWNYGTSGIAAIGDFSETSYVPEAMLRSIGNLAAFKLSSYDISPSGYYGDWPAIVGHRDLSSTACPANIHQHIPSIRVFADDEYWHYNRVYHQDYKAIGQGKNGYPTSQVSITSGNTANLYIDVENTGADTWRKSGSFPIRLGTQVSRDRSSPFANGSWIDASRPGSFTYYVMGYNPDGSANLQLADEILPGQVARFIIPITAPEVSSQSTYSEAFQLVAENYSWFIRDYQMKFDITVNPRSFAWHGTSQKVYTDETKNTLASASTIMNNLRAGQQYYVELKVQNDGNQTWVNTGAHPMKLGTYRNPDRPSAVRRSSTWLSDNRAAVMEEASVAPGQTATFNFWVEMPYHTTYREFKEYFNIVSEGQSWGVDQGMYWQFNVDAENLITHATNIAGYTDDSKTTPQNLAELQADQRYYVEVTLQNDGNVTWSPSGLRYIVLGTANPNDHSSQLCDSTWYDHTSCSRLNFSTQPSVSPSNVGTYGFWITAPSTPGTYTEYLNLVSEGFSWFRNDPIPFVVTVQ